MTYAYDAESRVTSVSVGGTLAAQYVYDAAGARVAKLNGAGAATAVYVLGPGGVYAELDSGDNIVHRDLYAGSALAASYDSTGALHLHLSDWLGTRRAQTDAAGVLQMTYASFPFGDGLASTAAAGYSGDDSNEKHFTGKERDAESGLDYFGARYLASSMGRFMSPDPIGIMKQKFVDPQQWNMYSYVRNNPLRMIDPTGKYNCTGTQQQCKDFEAARQKMLNSGNSKLYAAAIAYGSPGQRSHYMGKNHEDKTVMVLVAFGDLKKSDGAASTKWGVDDNGDKGLVVRFDPARLGLVGANEEGDSAKASKQNVALLFEYGAHEGSHTNDRINYLSTGTDMTRLASEENAYETQNEAHKILSGGVSQPDFKDKASIDAFIANNPDDYPAAKMSTNISAQEVEY